MDSRNSKPFEFRNKKKNNYAEKSYKYYRRRALQKVLIDLTQVQDKKKLRRIVKLRRIHLQRYISVKQNGTKWWNKWMAIYFGQLCEEEIVNCRNNTTSDVMLHFEEVRGQSRSYKDLFVYSSQPLLGDPKTLKFLFHGIYYQEENESQEEDIYELLIFNFKIGKDDDTNDDCYIADSDAVLFTPSQKPTAIKVNNIEKELDLRASYRVNASLNFITSVTNPSLLYNCLLYQQRLKRLQYNHLQCEISLLSEQLSRFHEQNILIWDEAIEQFRRQRDKLVDLRKACDQIQGLQTKLACRDRLLYFKKGFKDKTEDELQQALEQLQLEQKRLLYSRRAQKDRLASYNDCKICFYPQVKQGNEIVFCNLCHISYHKHCYGLNSVIDDQAYVCDACLWLQEKDIQQEDLRPHCSICYSRKNFPLKRVGNQFYHVTCIFFYNYAKVQSFPIALKNETQRQLIEKARGTQSPRCFYCLPHAEYPGICLKCEVNSCQLYFHPICAYLRGCTFDISRLEQLCVRVMCHQHTFRGMEQEQLRQVYIRRFFCNFQNIQPLTELQFKPLYQDEKLQIQIERRKLLQNHRCWSEYDHLRKKKRLSQVQPEDGIDYDSMTVEQLLLFSKGHQIKPDQQQRQQSFEENVGKDTEDGPNFIILD